MITIILVQKLAANLLIQYWENLLILNIRNTILNNHKIEILIQLVNIEELNAFSSKKYLSTEFSIIMPFL